ncbi:MAG: IS701 family transposase [Candidatus Methanoperedens sp.]
MDSKELQSCRSRLEAFLAELLEPLGRPERRRWGNAYVRGLLLDGERKSIEPMAARLPDANVQAMQQFVGQSPWDHNPVRKKLAERMIDAMVSAVAWIVDDTGFPKQGKHSVGVARQYSGTLGKVGNCQIAVSLNLATDEVCMPINFEIYLPKVWADDPGRLKRAGVPDRFSFRSKWQIALDLIDQAHSWDIPKGVVVCDCAYGNGNPFRQGLIDRELSYVAEIEAKTIVFYEPRKTRRRVGDPAPDNLTDKVSIFTVKDFALKLPAYMWKTIKWRQGTKGRLVSRFAAVRVVPAHRPAQVKKRPPRQWLLIEWPKGEPAPTKYWFSNLLSQAGISRLVFFAKVRWRIEQSYQQLKEELGLDHYEGRGYLGWHHHVTMTMLAYGFLLRETLRSKKNFWVDPPESETGDATPDSLLVGNMPDLP